MSILQRPSQQATTTVTTTSTQSNGSSSPKMMNGNGSAPISQRHVKRNKKGKTTSSKLLLGIGIVAILLGAFNLAGSLAHHGSLPTGITLVFTYSDGDTESESKLSLGSVSNKRGPKGQKRQNAEPLHYLPPPRKLHDKLKQQQPHLERKQKHTHKLPKKEQQQQPAKHAEFQPPKGGDFHLNPALVPKQKLAEQAAHDKVVAGKRPVITGQQQQYQKEVEKGEVHDMQYYWQLSRENGHDKEKLLKLLRNNAGIRMLSQQSYDALPSWSQVTAMYGDRPRLVGLEKCQAFQANGDLGDKFLAVAGAFNSGTNLLAKLLTRNCVLHKRQAKYGRKQRGIRWQVPYGKHTPPLDEEFRNSHVAAKSEGVDATQVLPAVMIRDPFRWLQSMCSHHYTSRWPRVFPRGDPRYHCPNLFPLEDEKTKLNELGIEPILEGSDTDLNALFNSFNSSKVRQRAIFVGIRPEKMNGKLGDNSDHDHDTHDEEGHDTQDDKSHDLQTEEQAAAKLTQEDYDRHYFPVRVRYSNFTREHSSLVHFYNDWYQEYIDLKDFPHLMVRMEDLLFFPDEVVPQICECAGGQLVTANDTSPGIHPVRVVAQSAKAKHSTKYMEEGEEHTGYLDALVKYGKSDTRFRGMTPQDLQYAGRHLDSNIMEMFGYDYPEKSSATSAK